ncbi:MAG TPA: 3-oxoacyl-[acyl-carrier-protein] synthase III C-terminal domain-containing protein [Chroococcales cyanobacterium]
MHSIYIDDFSYALGEVRSSVEDAAASHRTLSNSETLKESGFTFHHMLGSDRSAYELAQEALAPFSKNLDHVNAIVYSTCIPENGSVGDKSLYASTRDVKHLMDFPASHLQADYGLTGASVFGLNQQACTGMLGSLRLARMLLLSEPDVNDVLCVTADRFPADAIYEQAYCLISDGAATCRVSRTEGAFRLLSTHAITNGAMSLASDDETVGSFFSYSHNLITQLLQKSALCMADIDWIVPQNTNKKAWQVMSSLLRFDYQRVYFPTLPDVGHVISGDNIINLKHLLDSGKLASGEKVLLFMAGYGLNWQGAVLEKV